MKKAFDLALFIVAVLVAGLTGMSCSDPANFNPWGIFFSLFAMVGVLVIDREQYKRQDD